ncbi:MAG: trypsin-like peptidase domain-containing protein [Planctomycetaceae bacterium]|nr:trypsin-like peptidase domain-containing protein [Planctomycetaceae bacterium]
MRCPTAAFCLLVLCTAAAASGAPPRYAALLTSGQRIQGDKLSDWHDKNAMPRLEGQPLLEPANSFRWLRDRTLRLADLPAAYVEFHGGDRLPGVAIDYRTGKELAYDPLPAHLLVQSAQSFEPPENRTVSEIRVAVASIRRIVWQRRGRQPYQPGTAILRDGKTQAYRAVRFQPGQVHLLLAEGGDQRIPWSDLAELHLPAADSWDSCFDELVQLCPHLDTRLYQVETTRGLVATSSLARWVSRFEGNSAEPDRWVHGIQPAWSLDILWIPCREIVYRRSWLPREVPLSRLPTTAKRGDRPAKAAVNANFMGESLRSQSLDFGWGLGVHGRSELMFDLHDSVRSLRTQVCLDRAAGKGGCILAKVFASEPTGNPLWQSPLLVGSETVADTGALAIPGPAGPKRIVLQVDPVAQGRPAGTDPLEIRDHADWCDPLLDLDPTAVQTEFDKRIAHRFPAWRDWTVRPIGASTLTEAGVEVTAQRNERRPLPGSFHQAIQAKARSLAISKRLTIGPRDQWLLVAATRSFSRGQEPKLEVRIGGEAVAEFTIPERQHETDENRPLAVSLAAYCQSKPVEIDVEIRQLAAADSAPVEYRAIETAEQLPTLHRLFEEQEPAPADAAIVEDDRHAGTRSLKLATGKEFRWPLAEPIRIRERPAWGEFRFLRFAVRKLGGGQATLAFEAADQRDQPRRYDLGQGPPAFGGATRVWPDLGNEWVVVTRDLYADFGNFDVQAVLLGAPGGDAVLFDHFYFARGHFDLDRIPQAPSPEATNEKARQELARPLIKRARPATVRLDFPDGRAATGVLIDQQGEILTAGHAVIGPGRPVRVKLADGTELAAKTLGVAREFDLGLVRIEPAGVFPKLDPDAPAEIPQQQAYLALFYPARVAEFERPAGEIVSLRRVFRSTVWTDLESDAEWLAGGPLVNRDGRLIGIQTRPSRFGGVLCTRFQDAWPQMQRVRNGEVFGAWQAGSEPVLGARGRGKAEGWELVEIVPGGPAFQAGLKVGDVVTRLDGRPIAGDEDLSLALAERDASQEVTIDFVRATAASQSKAKLAPRVP